MQDYSVGAKVKYYSSLSKKGSVDKNGNRLSDFQRGVCFGKAKMLSYCASKINKIKHNLNPKTQNLNFNERKYSDDELNKLFDNLSDLDVD